MNAVRQPAQLGPCSKCRHWNTSLGVILVPRLVFQATPAPLAASGGTTHYILYTSLLTDKAAPLSDLAIFLLYILYTVMLPKIRANLVCLMSENNNYILCYCLFCSCDNQQTGIVNTVLDKKAIWGYRHNPMSHHTTENSLAYGQEEFP